MPPAFVDPGSEFTAGAVGAATSAAATVAAGVLGAVFDGLRSLARIPLPGQGATRTVLERPRACGVAESAGTYLFNLQRDGLDQALRAIPPRTFEWKLPTGHAFVVRQLLGKDGLTFDVEVKEPLGKTWRLQHVRAEVTAKGIKIPAGRVPLQVGDRSFGHVDVALRADTAGLNEVTLQHTSDQGQVSTVKLKTRPCDPDAVQGGMLRQNIGSADDARYWGEAHLARSARSRGGRLHQGLTDLLMQVRPSASGTYRNHGSRALELLTRPLELLRGAGTDLSGLHAIQQQQARLPRDAAGRPLDPQAFRAQRQRAWAWLQGELQRAIDEGRLQPGQLVNRFGLNYGLDAVRQQQAAQARPQPGVAAPRQRQAYAVGEGIGTPYGRAVWAGLDPEGRGQVRTRAATYTVPAGTVELGSRDAVRAWVLRSVERGHIQPAHLYGASQAGYLDGERVGTPHGDLFFRAAGDDGQPELRGRGKSYRLKPGLDLRHRDAVRAWVIRAIEQGQIDRAALHPPTATSAAAARAPGVQDAWPTKVKAHWRELQQVVRQRGWEVSQLPDGRLFVWRLGGQVEAADLGRAVAAAMGVPATRLHVTAASQVALGQPRQGFALAARVYAR